MNLVYNFHLIHFKIHFNSILPYTPRYSEAFQSFYAFLMSAVCAACPANPILFDLITLILFEGHVIMKEEYCYYKSWRNARLCHHFEVQEGNCSVVEHNYRVFLWARSKLWCYIRWFLFPVSVSTSKQLMYQALPLRSLNMVQFLKGFKYDATRCSVQFFLPPAAIQNIYSVWNRCWIHRGFVNISPNVLDI
jgi:hypothetical protein